MIITGTLTKMLTEYENPVRYYMNFKNSFVDVNQSIGKSFNIKHVSNECKSCKLNKPIFRMGFCKNCFFTVPQANPSILKPELSTAHLNVEQRDLEWEKNFELQPHIVYLAISGGLKVGVTRETQIPYRWIDQGASKAIILTETNNRFEAGVIEVKLKEHFSDKTNWRKMLTNENPDTDLLQVKTEVLELIEDKKIEQLNNGKIWEINYPIANHPKKVKSVNLSKTPEFHGELIGIQGQYLIFKNGFVLNVRNHEGFVVNLDIN